MMQTVTDRIFNNWSHWRGKKWFICRGCGGVYPVQERRLFFLSITQDLADLLEHPGRVGKIEVIALCEQCSEREQHERQKKARADT